jgi:hypothetical protein
VYQHIVVIMDENLSLAHEKQSGQATFLHQLKTQCGSYSNMHAATHPSQANYMAATSGKATSSGVYSSADNIFAQVERYGGSARNYAESLPDGCPRSQNSTPQWKAGHAPAFWYTDLAQAKGCKTDLVPISQLYDDIASDLLPTYAWVTPDACNDMHWLATCGYPQTSRVGVGDAWLSTLVDQLTSTPSYLAGQTLVIVTFDEGDGPATYGADCTARSYYQSHPDCRIATLVASPYIVPGAVDGSDQNLYSLLGTIEDILGYPRLGAAVGQGSMRPGLHF